MLRSFSSSFSSSNGCTDRFSRTRKRTRTRGKGNRAGLTLIEVILATAILAIGMGVLVAATGRCLAVARKAKQYEIARRLVGQVDLEIPIEFEELEEGVESGRFGEPYREYTWQREIIEFEDEEMEMFTVVTTVYWNNRGSEASESVTTYIYGPTYVRGGGPSAP